MILNGTKILLIVTGGIAAYKTPELVRLFKKAGASVRCILTKGGAQFVTPLTLESLSQNKVYTDLWSLTDEQEMGHIRLARDADVVLVAPATADMLAKMAHGLADDLASTCLLATDKPVLVAPAMNPNMYAHAATQANLNTLRARGVTVLEPACGDMACGEQGLGRMREPQQLCDDVSAFLRQGILAGLKAVVTSGPTMEPIDPVRYIANHSSGKQGHAIAAALAAAGATVTLVTGPVQLDDPARVRTIHIKTAAEMRDAVLGAMPADIAVCAAAVCDWAPIAQPAKLKKTGGAAPALTFTETPDILKTLGHLPTGKRPRLVVGFAAETGDVETYARAKVQSKNADWILGNNVADGKIFGADDGHVVLYPVGEDWGQLSKTEIAQKLVQKIAERFAA